MGVGRITNKEWYGYFIATWMWKSDSGLPPRIVWFRMDNETFHDIEHWLNESMDCDKLG